MVDALADPCMVLDRRTVVVHANAAAARQFPSVTAGNPITFAMRNPDLVQAIDAVIRTGTTRSVELHETVPSETWEKVVRKLRARQMPPVGKRRPNEKEYNTIVAALETKLDKIAAARSHEICGSHG